jgi:hypothetical protein
MIHFITILECTPSAYEKVIEQQIAASHRLVHFTASPVCIKKSCQVTGQYHLSLFTYTDIRMMKMPNEAFPECTPIINQLVTI